MGGRNRLTTLVIIITTHIGVTGLASYHRYRRIEHVHWITSKHWTESAYCHSFGSREMSELWLPRWHCPFLFWPRGGRKRRVGFWTWDCGWLMAINSISHLSSLPHYWVVAGLSWWVLPCCCEAGLLEEGASKEQRRSAAEEAATACSDVRSTAEQQQGSTHQLNPAIRSFDRRRAAFRGCSAILKVPGGRRVGGAPAPGCLRAYR